MARTITRTTATTEDGSGHHMRYCTLMVLGSEWAKLDIIKYHTLHQLYSSAFLNKED